jgi:hypothetical protein
MLLVLKSLTWLVERLKVVVFNCHTNTRALVARVALADKALHAQDR